MEPLESASVQCLRRLISHRNQPLTDPTPRPEAEDVYREFAERRSRGDSVNLDEYVKRHPRLANALRALHSLHAGDVADETPGDADSTLEAPSPAIDAARTATEHFLEALDELPAREDSSTRTPLSPGTHVGSFRVDEILGEGGFAFVYRATQLEPVERTVALKTLKLGVDTREVLARFDAERQTLAMMQHSHIAKVFDAGVTDDGRPYFVLELVEGAPLVEYCDRRAFSIDARLDLFVLICDAVQHAHQKAIIHRDLKPSNILVAEEDGRAVPKIIDFGIAKAIGAKADGAASELTIEGQVIGTPDYMSPEQAGGGEIDTRADIYALGCILYELLTGERPLDGRSFLKLGLLGWLEAIREVDPPSPSTRVRSLRTDSSGAEPSTKPGPAEKLESGTRSELARERGTTASVLHRRLRGDLDWITMKALAKDPSARYASASELASDLRRHRSNLPVLAGPPSVRYRLGRFARRHRRSLVGLAVTCAVASVVGLVVHGLVEARHERQMLKDGTKLVLDGRRFSKQVDDTLKTLEGQEAAYQRIRASLPEWAPIWERGAELDAWRRISTLKTELASGYGRTLGAFTNARSTAPSGSRPWRDASFGLETLYDTIQARTDLALDQVLAEVSGNPVSADSADRIRTSVHLRTEPTGASVACYRFELIEERLVPLAFDIQSARTVGRPSLIVEEVLDADRAQLLDLTRSQTVAEPVVDRFRPSDHLTSVNGRRVETRSDLASALEGIELDAPVSVSLLRSGTALERTWVPFRSVDYDDAARTNHLEAGRLVSIRDQLGLLFEGYPLEPHPSCRLGTTGEVPISIELIPGSYVLSIEKPGYASVCFPIHVRGGLEFDETVRLVEANRIPEGYAYIPAGRGIIGGSDSEYLQTLPYGDRRCHAFAMARLEVKFDEYMTFLNDRVGAEGSLVEARSEEARAELRLKGLANRDSAPSMLVELRPFRRLARRDGKTVRDFLVRHDGSRWVPTSPKCHTWPVLGISFLAAAEYAHWLTSNDPAGRTFRLPTDEEWERAGRGADGRVFPWGNYMVWNYSFSKNGSHRAPPRVPPERRGISPLDESVFGIRDLAGSVSEPTLGRPKAGRRYIVRRGGAWDAEDLYEFRLDTRVGFLPESLSLGLGIRLVCEVGDSVRDASEEEEKEEEGGTTNEH